MFANARRLFAVSGIAVALSWGASDPAAALPLAGSWGSGLAFAGSSDLRLEGSGFTAPVLAAALGTRGELFAASAQEPQSTGLDFDFGWTVLPSYSRTGAWIWDPRGTRTQRGWTYVAPSQQPAPQPPYTATTPEPGAALVFGVGLLVAGASVRIRGAR